MKHEIELTPLQVHAWRAGKMVNTTAGNEIGVLTNQIEELRRRVQGIYKEASSVLDEIFQEIGREHGYESVPADRAEIVEKGQLIRVSWEDDESPSESESPPSAAAPPSAPSSQEAPTESPEGSSPVPSPEPEPELQVERESCPA